ncbi:uncharacterized protein J7T55_009159 [Diaporthe amygdali]|uniref:uncharacterized protein n=1 Tax=Phomopsis amygdali TaxID=1214568 RepID=UPI0022FF1C4A|nr:uncharacterized protein J7T55_009159 [Diaporthe amygdali]KAJ0118376.1 uncharacterized protein J7T55_009159 [Diaporthe amygdali]
MAPKRDQGGSQTGFDVLDSVHKGDERDPPPPPSHRDNTAEEAALAEEQRNAWILRNLGYLQSFDVRGLHQLPLLSRLWGYDFGWYGLSIMFKIADLTMLAGRRLNPQEMSVFASHTARGVVAASYDRPIAIGATSFALWRGWSSYRMPFYQPKFTTWVHPQASRRPFLSSLAWHSARVGIYGLVGLSAYKLFSDRYIDYMLVNFAEDALKFDPALKKINQDMNNNLDRLRSERARRHGKTE